MLLHGGCIKAFVQSLGKSRGYHAQIMRYELDGGFGMLLLK